MIEPRRLPRPTRRHVLRLGALAATSTLLAACASPSASPTAQPAAQPTAQPAAKATAAPTSPAAAATAPAATAPAAKPTAPATSAPAAKPTAPAVAGKAAVTLTWATPGNPAEVAVYEQLARKFEAENPGITVKTDRESSDFQKMTTLIAGGNPPDILFFTINNWPAFAGRKVLMPLDDMIKVSKFDVEDFYPQILKPYRYDEATRQFGEGKLYGLPKEIAVRSMYFNADLFKAAGVAAPAPDKPFTWEQFLDAAQKTTRREGDRVAQYGYVQETWWGMWAIWAWANGGQVVDDVYKPTKATMDDPKVVEALKFWADMVTEHKVAPPAAVTKEQGKSEMFAAGKAATYNNGRWMVPLFRKSTFAWDVMPMPMKAKRAQLLTGSIFAVSQGTKYPEETWKLLSFITGKEGQRLMTELGLLLPSRKSVAESDQFLKSAPPASNRVYIDELQYAQPLPMHPKYPQMEKAVGDEVDLVLAGSKPAAEAAKVMTAKVNELLKG